MANFKLVIYTVVAIVILIILLVVNNVDGVMSKVRSKQAINTSKIIFTAPSTSSKRHSKRQSTCPLNSTVPCAIEKSPSNGKQSKKIVPSKNVSDDEDSLVDESEFIYDEDQDKSLVTEKDTVVSSDESSMEDMKVRPRLIAVKVAAHPPKRNANATGPIQSLYGKYPTVRLADFARKIIFPEWIWTRFSQPPINKKSEVADAFNSETPSGRPLDRHGNDTFVPSTTTRRPKGILERPTITFDNNMSRFLRLFTVVRFQNLPCTGPSGENGTCYHGKECADLGGQGTSPCAQGLGVCCLFYKSCGETVNRNGTYFVSKGASFTRGVTTCNINVHKVNPSIRQIRLDLHNFVMLPPNAGNCDTDRFLVSGQNTNNIVPILCGNNSGSHVYIETGTSQSVIQLSVMTTGEGPRSWSIQINQIEESHSQYTAPSHCLQYYEGTMGTISSFNYDSTISPQYLNNLNYAICIRKEAGFCSVTYTNLVPDGQYYPFQIVNADAQGNLLLPSGQAGVGIRNCPDDFIILNGIRLCGERINDGTKSTLMTDDVPVTDATNGPFTVMIRTNEIDVGGGFSIYYRQNPCMSTAG